MDKVGLFITSKFYATLMTSSTYRFQTKIRHGCFKSYLLVKRVIYPPEQYLVFNVEKVKLEDGRLVWFTNCADYLKRLIENFNNSLVVDNKALKNNGDGHTPYSSIFRP